MNVADQYSHKLFKTPETIAGAKLMTSTIKNNEPVILVTGATGTVGSEVVKQLISSSQSSLSSGSRVRAAVHSKNKADKLRDEIKLVDIVDMDYNKPETIVDAVNGIDKLFLLTLPRPNMSEITSIPPNII